MDDIFSPTPQEKQAALARLLAGNTQPAASDVMQGWGNLLAQGGGNLGEFGRSQVQQGMQAAKSQQAGIGQALQMALEQQRADSAERHQRAQEDLQRRQIEMGKFGSSPMGIFNTRNGELVHPAEPKNGTTGGMTAKQLADEFDRYRKAISSTEGRGHIAVPLQQAINRAEAVETLIRDPKTGEPLNLIPGQVREAATGLAQVIQQGGQPALQQIEEMTPHTMAGKFANAKQYLLNEPQGAEAQAFLAQMLDTLAREKGTALKQLRSAQLKNVPAFAGLRQIDKKRFDSMLKAEGIDPATIGDDGLLIQQTPAAPQLSATAQQYVDLARERLKANPNDETALKVLKHHGLAP